MNTMLAPESNGKRQPGFFGRSVQSFRRRILDRMVLRPTRHAIAFEPKRRESLQCGRFVIDCFVQSFLHDESVPPELLVIKFPGTAGRAERATEFPRKHLPGTSCEIWTWNPPGYGNSAGRASLTTIPDAAIEFFRAVKARMGSSRPRIWLVGNSLGCATAGYVASREEVDIDGLILRNPPPLVEIVKRVARRYPMGHLTDPVSESLPQEMNLLRTARQITAPTVLFQSELDELVPPESQMRVFEALQGEKQLYVMEGLGHGGIATEDLEHEMAELIRWLDRASPARVSS